MRTAILVLFAACSAAPRRPAPPPAPKGTDFHATVRWTSDGVPHVTAADFASLGFGQGWAAASLHLCVIEDQVVRVRSERAKFFGPGDGGANLDSDFFHLHLGFAGRAKDAIAHASPEARALAHGYAVGFDRWLALHADQAPAACKGAAWVRPITDEDLAAMWLAIATTASSRAFEPLIANAAPRGAKSARRSLPDTNVLASNAWAVGGDRTRSGGGLLLANPHFPWEGDLQFTEAQLTIPGQLDVYGAGLVGTPGVEIGFDAHVAWTHTFSSSTHFAIYRVPLSKGDPMKLAIGDPPEPIAAATYTIQSRKSDGSLEDVTRTLYRTRWGPMIDSADLPWDPATGTAYTFKDVADDDGGSLDMYLAFARAGTVDDIQRALRGSHTPFVNTIAADDRGDALYVDASRVPALSEDGLAAWTLGRRAIPALERAWQKGVVVLDASMPVFELAGDSHGAIPIDAHTPSLRRRDFVTNANGAYQFTHRGVEISANSPLYGDATAPSLRTLANWDLVGGDAKLDRDAAIALLFSDRSSTSERLLDEVRAACAPLCPQLVGWDGAFTTSSKAAPLWREFLTQIAPDGRIPWAHPFDPNDPETPRGLALSHEQIRAAFAHISNGGQTLGELQTAATPHGRVGVPGGQQLDGVANVVAWNPGLNATLLPRDDGGGARYPVNFGSSFVMAVDLDPKSGPRANVLLTYGNSSDPASPHYRDQLAMFAAGRTRPARFTAADVNADPDLKTEDLRYTEPAP
jgi:acyl-homoserine-lactone acylase